MRYVIISVVNQAAGDFNNNLRKEVFDKFNVKSSKLPAHFTIKSPFEADDIKQLEDTLDDFTSKHKSENYKIEGYNHFDDRVIYMDVKVNKSFKLLHDNLIKELDNIPYIHFSNHDGIKKIFHVTISSKKIKNIFDELWDYVNKIPCDFECVFDNISIFKWQNNNWVLHKKYLFYK